MGSESSRLDELFDAARYGEWEKAKRLIDKYPQLMWTYNPRRDYRYPFVSYLMTQCSSNDDEEEKTKDLMRYMKNKAFSMAKTHNEYKEILRKIFEAEDDMGRPPIFYAVTAFDSFKFFIEEFCSDGVDALKREDKYGHLLIYSAVVNYFNVESFEYVVQHASNGSDILRTGNRDYIAAIRNSEQDRLNARYSFPTFERKASKYLKSTRAKSFFLRQEKKYLEKGMEYFNDEDCLINLVLGVVVQNTELICYRECR